MNELSVDKKAEFYDRDQSYQKELMAAPYQLFRVTQEGKWVPVLARNCAPHPDGDDNRKLVAIVNGEPCNVKVKPAGSSKAWFAGGDDCEMEYSFDLIANGLCVGSCSYREY